MRSNYTDDKLRTINRNMLMNQRRHVGQDDKVWSALVLLLARRTEKWWGLVMDVGLDPELTKWSVRPGPGIVLTGKGYKECHWSVIPPSTTSVISTSIQLALHFYHANVRTLHPRYSGSVWQGPHRCSGLRSDRKPHQRWEGYYSLHVQQGRISSKSFRISRYTCVDWFLVCT